MKYKKLISFLAFFLAVLSVYGQNPFVLKSGEPVTVACGNSEEEVVHTALNLLNRDVESVFSTRIIVTPESKKGMIIYSLKHSLTGFHYLQFASTMRTNTFRMV